MPLQKSCPKLSSLLLIVVHILSINHTRKKGFLKRNDPYLVTSANDDRWPQDLLTWHLYLAGDLPPTSLSALHNVHPPLPTLGCSPAKLCVRLLLPYLAIPSFNAEGREWVSPLSGPASLTYWTPFLPTFANHSRLSGVACIGIQWRLIYTVITLPEGNDCIYSWPWMISSPKSVTCLYTNVNCKIGFMKGTIDNFSTSLTNILCKFMWNDLIIYWDI